VGEEGGGEKLFSMWGKKRREVRAPAGTEGRRHWSNVAMGEGEKGGSVMKDAGQARRKKGSTGVGEDGAGRCGPLARERMNLSFYGEKKRAKEGNWKGDRSGEGKRKPCHRDGKG